MTTNEMLFAKFEELSTVEWINGIEKYLKGQSYTSLHKEIEEGLTIAPLFRIEDRPSSVLPLAASSDWLINEHFDVGPTPFTTNKELLSALERGVNSITLNLQTKNPVDLSIVLKDVYIDMVDINLEGIGLQQDPHGFLNSLLELESIQNSKGSFSFNSIETSLTLFTTYAKKLPQWTFFQVNISNEKSPSQGLGEGIQKANI